MKSLSIATFSLLQRQRYAVLVVYVAIFIAYLGFFWAPFAQNVFSESWVIAPIMALGSFVAGSTFLGGGSVAFPALTKILSMDPVNAKVFSLAIQSVGMVSASLYIILRVRNLPLAFIAVFISAAGLGVYTALTFLEGIIASIDLRIGFTLFILCFLGVYLVTRHSANVSTETHLETTLRDISLTLACGFLGGLVSGLLGSGADLIGFSLLALYFRIEIKRATQISVILMAAVSVIGILVQIGMGRPLSNEVLSLWYVAAPVVLFGAPIGAMFCRKISSRVLIVFIVLIVCVETLSTLILIPIDQQRLIYYGLAGLVSICLLLGFKQLANKKHR